MTAPRRPRSPSRPITKIHHLPWIPWHVADFARDTQDLNVIEHGAYRLLLDFYYLTGKWPPDDDARLAVIARCAPEQWAAARPAVAPFFKIGGGLWRHLRAESVAHYALQTYQNYAKAGRLGGQERVRRAKGLPSTASSDATSDASRNQNQNQKKKKKESVIREEDSVESPSARVSRKTRATPGHNSKSHPQLFPSEEEPRHDDSQRGTRLPADWQPSADDRNFAIDLGLDPEQVIAEFRDYWHDKPGAAGRKIRWSGTFRNRCRHLADSTPKGAARPKNARPSRGGGLAGAVDRVRDRLSNARRDRN